MKRNPLIPFGVIAVLAILMITFVSFYGAHQFNQRAEEQKNGGAKQSETANAKPEDIFKQNCSSCHGQNLEGGAGPNLTKVGSKLSQDQILNQIKNGGGGMPGNLIQGDAAQKVAAWLADKK